MRKFDIANGTGIRSSLFVSGCTHQCSGCFNEPYREFNHGNKWTKESEDMFLTYAKDPNVHGITILGGEPMDQTYDNALVELLHRIKQETSQNVWIYSGYTFEAIMKDPKKREILELCDVLVDGPFVEQLKDIKLKFRGSSNQRIIDIPASLDCDQVILLEV